jgi:hypothetical protein
MLAHDSCAGAAYPVSSRPGSIQSKCPRPPTCSSVARPELPVLRVRRRAALPATRGAQRGGRTRPGRRGRCQPRSDSSSTEDRLSRSIIAAWSSSSCWRPFAVVARSMILARASSWRISPRAFPCRFAGSSRTPAEPGARRWPRRRPPAPPVAVSVDTDEAPPAGYLAQAVADPVNAGERREGVVDRRDSARIAISTSWSTPKETSWARVRYGPVTCAPDSSRATPSAASAGHTVA